jgi:cytochrome c peroxidase
MNRFIRHVSGAFALVLTHAVSSAEPGIEDRMLRKVIEAYEVRPLAPRPVTLGPKEKLGQALFFDPIVSGPRSISCAACHVRSKGAGDGLPVAVGLGASGVGTERLAASRAFLVPRNALPFFNRGRNEFTALFWDGRVQRGPGGSIETPLGDRQPPGFENLLAAAAVFPPAEPDEMLGRTEERRKNPGKYHGALIPDTPADENNFQERTLVVFDSLLKRLFGESQGNPSTVQTKYRALLAEAFPGIDARSVQIAHVGNALSAYIGAAFELQPAPWDRYVGGNARELTTEQKRGALLFFGKGRCATCHTGTQFSDFRFHGLAVPQLSVGKHGSFLDYGRASATSLGADRFLFRTPPLRNVATTGPWGHNGVFDSLETVISHHFNPVPALYRAQQSFPETGGHAGRLLAQRSPILGEVAPFTSAELRSVVAFLGSLSSSTVMSDETALPTSVPSGNGVFIRR